jgi:hypothetical protein
VAETTAQNPLDLWRQFLTDSERQWNGFFKDVLGTDAFSNAMNMWVETSLTVQRMVADNLERYYSAFNIPTHGDLVALGERMKAVEETLARLEAAISASSPEVAARTKPRRAKPRRTKQPPAGAAPRPAAAPAATEAPPAVPAPTAVHTNGTTA